MNNSPGERLPLKGSERPALKEAKKIGPLDPKQPVMVTIIVRGRVTDEKRHDHNGKFERHRKDSAPLNHETFANTFGADESELAEVADFARGHNLEVTLSHSARRSVVVKGTAAQINEAFGVSLNLYQSSHGGFHGFEGRVMLPAAIHKLVESVIGLDNRPTNARHVVADPNDPAITNPLTPQTVATLYNFPSGQGIGQTIGIYEMSTKGTPSPGYDVIDLSLTILTNGSAIYPQITDVPIDDGQNSGVSDSETMLDISVATGIASAAAIAVYFAPNNAQGILHAIQAMVHPLAGQPVPTVISISYYWDFDALTDTLSDDDYQQLGKLFRDASDLFITVLAATGDNGATFGAFTTGYAAYPASDPKVLACGGTTIGNIDRLRNNFDEYVWNDTSGTTGGGISDRFAIPGYQLGVNMPVQMNSGKAGRGIPDVAGNASRNSGYTIFLAGVSVFIGGTSAVAPLYAGLVAIINSLLKAGGSLYPAGFINPLLYENAATICRDVTAVAGPANNAPPGGSGYAAGIGWDACTGLGSIHGNRLLRALSPLACQIVFKKMDRCDPGPVENTTAVFIAEVTGGVAPLTFNWAPPVQAAAAPGETGNKPDFSVSVPPAGTSFTVSVTITDQAGIPLVVSATFPSLSVEMAGIEHAFCEFRSWGYEFRPPIYINPGDPYRIRPFTIEQLMKMHDLTSRISALTQAALKKRLTFETGNLKGK